MTNSVSIGLRQGGEIKLKSLLALTLNCSGRISLMIGRNFYCGPLLDFFLFMGYLKDNLWVFGSPYSLS